MPTETTFDCGLSAITFSSPKAERRVDVELTALPPASIAALLRYGAQRFINDKLGGADKTQADAATEFDEILAELRAGWTGRQGGAKLDLTSAVWRDTLTPHLVAIGMKKADATKLARDRDAALHALATDHARRSGRGDVATIADALGRGLEPKVLAEVERRRAAEGPSTGDLDAILAAEGL